MPYAKCPRCKKLAFYSLDETDGEDWTNMSFAPFMCSKCRTVLVNEQMARLRAEVRDEKDRERGIL